MENYKKLYFTLFNAMTDAIEQLEAHQYSLAVITLEQAQKEAEKLYIAGGRDGEINSPVPAL